MDQSILIDYIEYYKDYLLLYNNSERTIKEYGYDLMLFDTFLKEKNFYKNIHSLEDIADRHIERFIVYLRKEKLNNNGENLSPLTINRKLSTLRSFFSYLIKKRYLLGENPVNSIETLSTTKLSTHTYLSISQSTQLIEFVKDRPRDSLIINLMLLLGLRVSEVSKLNITDINFENSKIKVHGKGDKERDLHLSKELEEIVLMYLDYRNKVYPNPIDKYALFISRKNTRLSPRMIQIIFKDIVDKLGFNEGKEKEPSRNKITCHKLRHTCGTLLVQNGTAILTVKEVLGHSSVNTTQIYAKASDEQVKDALVNNPLNKLLG